MIDLLLRRTDIVNVVRYANGNLVDGCRDPVKMTIGEALKHEQWDSTNGTMTYSVDLLNVDEVKTRFIKRKNQNLDIRATSVFLKKGRAYVTAIEDWEIQLYS